LRGGGTGLVGHQNILGGFRWDLLTPFTDKEMGAIHHNAILHHLRKDVANGDLLGLARGNEAERTLVVVVVVIIIVGRRREKRGQRRIST